MKIVIMAAGKGTRMLPLTEHTHKSLIPLFTEDVGVPFMHYVLKTIAIAAPDLRPQNIGVVANYKIEQLEWFLTRNHPGIQVIRQPETNGTGGAVLAAGGFTEDEDFIVLSGDNLYNPKDIKALHNRFPGNYVSSFFSDTPSKYGVIKVDGSGNLCRIVEKPKEFLGNMINAALYKFTPKIYDALDRIEPSPRGELELPDAVNVLAKDGSVRIHQLHNGWKDFGCPADINPMENYIREEMLL